MILPFFLQTFPLQHLQGDPQRQEPLSQELSNNNHLSLQKVIQLLNIMQMLMLLPPPLILTPPPPLLLFLLLISLFINHKQSQASSCTWTYMATPARGGSSCTAITSTSWRRRCLHFSTQNSCPLTLQTLTFLHATSLLKTCF